MALPITGDLLAALSPGPDDRFDPSTLIIFSSRPVGTSSETPPLTVENGARVCRLPKSPCARHLGILGRSRTMLESWASDRAARIWKPEALHTRIRSTW